MISHTDLHYFSFASFKFDHLEQTDTIGGYTSKTLMKNCNFFPDSNHKFLSSSALLQPIVLSQENFYQLEICWIFNNRQQGIKKYSFTAETNSFFVPEN